MHLGMIGLGAPDRVESIRKDTSTDEIMSRVSSHLFGTSPRCGVAHLPAAWKLIFEWVYILTTAVNFEEWDAL
jgi:hypothetical protein